jgi:regulator of protease activity HflC (stomatin/prohibitin superfamily)
MTEKELLRAFFDHVGQAAPSLWMRQNATGAAIAWEKESIELMLEYRKFRATPATKGTGMKFKINQRLLFLSLALIVLLFSGLTWAVAGLTWLVSQPSDAAVVAGLLGVVALCGSVWWCGFGISKLLRKAIKVLPAALLVFIAQGCAGCERVNAGHVGIKIQLAGTNRGVQDVPLVTGIVFYNPITEDVLEYPIFVQTAVWRKPEATPAAGEPNEELSFNDKDGVIMTADVSLSYQIAAPKVPAFYVKFRSDDLAGFTHGYLRNVARDQLNEVAGTYSVEALYGPQKEVFIRDVKARINRELAPVGVSIEQFGFIGAPRPPQNVINAVNAKIAATQLAMQVENELRTAEAEARKTVAVADGAAKANIARAEGEAKSKVALAEGEAKANNLVASSITPQLLQWRHYQITERAVEKWNGARPMVEGGSAGILLQLPAAP